MIDLVDIAPDFSYIIGRGFRQTSGMYDEEAFGNAYVEMTGAHFSLRFTRDRGQILVEIGQELLGWFPLGYVLRFVDKSITIELLGGAPPRIENLAKFLQLNWDSVIRVFAAQEQISSLNKFIDEEEDTFLRKMRGKMR